MPLDLLAIRFPAASADASFCPLFQRIDLNIASEGEVRDALSGLKAHEAVRVLPTLCHELRHWRDLLCTTWGKSRIRQMFNALNARHSNREEDFYVICEWDKVRTADKLGDYYSTKGESQGHSSPHRWMHQLSCGRRFDRDGRLDANAPIFFTRFAWDDGRPACRVPLTVESLLEINATAAELTVNHASITSLPDGVRQVEQSLHRQKVLDRLYSPNLGVYSVGAHLAANVHTISDIAVALPLASALASAALDIPESEFDKVRVPTDFADWGNLPVAALARGDRGFLYLCLVYHARGQVCEDLAATADRTLRAAGLGDMTSMFRKIQAAHQKMPGLAFAGPAQDRFIQLENVEQRVSLSSWSRWDPAHFATSWPTLPLPQIATADGARLRLGSTNGINDATKCSQWESEVTALLPHVSVFLSACGT